MALGFHSLSTQEKVGIMTDFEMVSIVIMMIMLVISAMGINKAMPPSSVNCMAAPQNRADKPYGSVIPSCLYSTMVPFNCQ